MILSRKLETVTGNLFYRFFHTAVQIAFKSDNRFSAVLEWIASDNKRFADLLEHILGNDLYFIKLLEHAIKNDRRLAFMLNYFIESDHSYQKLMSLIRDTEVGTQNERQREEWLARTLSTIPAGSRLLDAGAGESQYKRFCDHLDYVSQDFAQYDGSGDTSGLQVGQWNQNALDIVSDITAIPEPDGAFDAIMCIEVLEHVPDPILAIKELSRLLRKGGTLIITAPFCSLTHFAPYHVVAGFNRYFYYAHLPALGFNVREVTPNGNYFDYLAQELRRLHYVSERYAHDAPDRREQLAIKVLLSMMDRLTKKNIRSEELLNFGYLVVAQKA